MTPLGPAPVTKEMVIVYYKDVPFLAAAVRLSRNQRANLNINVLYIFS